MKIKNKYLIGIGTLSTIAILPITVVACGTTTSESAENFKKIDLELEKIISANFKVTNNTKLASEINAANLQTEITKNFNNTINSVNFTYSISTKTAINDEIGTLTLTLTGQIGTDSRTKEITITGFETATQRKAKIKVELEKLNLVKIGAFATTLPSEVKLDNVNTFFEALPEANGVSFKSSLISLENNVDGTLTITIEGSIGKVIETKTFPITGFQKLDQRNQILDNELAKIANLTLKGDFATTLPSEVTADNIRELITTPEPINGVIFRIFWTPQNEEEKNLSDSTGTLKFRIDAFTNENPLIFRDKEFSVSGFRMNSQSLLGEIKKI
ncbi:lipoprotein 17-related variable surface protein [[Mycoplasma] mobile]|uniref:Variable surface protein mvspH n=1 Tax=Mycoplasma mobile (strain ATCC 43663 / 163K / NCTC 11711) TaxID=267748 RepID=Q6KHV7_MYCM1|nr:lipoprotein 17-related variable surface protein [[Mycoplasma] mobile]AAT27819.1 variable surface protein mvspH [Mycoplasma mobile 163K]